MKNKIIMVVSIVLVLVVANMITIDLKKDMEVKYINDNFKSYTLDNDNNIYIELTDSSGYYSNIIEDIRSYRLINKNEDMFLLLENRLMIQLNSRDIEKVDITKSNYSDYKASFIALNGLSWWDEATEEVGIRNELCSYIHFLIYKI